MSVPAVILLALASLSPEDVAEAAGCRCGRLIIVGNTDTPDGIILRMVPFRPGQKLLAAEVKAARRQIQTCGLFRSDPAPSVQVLPNDFDSDLLDVMIQIEERPLNRYLFWFPEHLLLAIDCPEVLGAVLVLAGEEAVDTIADAVELAADLFAQRTVP